MQRYKVTAKVKAAVEDKGEISGGTQRARAAVKFKLGGVGVIRVGVQCSINI